MAQKAKKDKRAKASPAEPVLYGGVVTCEKRICFTGSSIPDSLDSFTQRAEQMTAVLAEILRKRLPPIPAARGA